MAVAVNHAGYFRTKEDAIAEIAAQGWWPMSWIDKPGSSYEEHYHAGDETLYMVEGVLEFTDTAAGVTHVLKPGDKLFLPARVVHSVSTEVGATYVLGLSVLVPFDDHFIPAG